MSASPGAGRIVLGPDQDAAWVSEHGAHLMDYAACHLAPDRVVAAVASALAACRVQATPKNVTARGRLLAVLRRGCCTAPGYRQQYVPGSGPGMPEERLIERVWTIVDPLGTETLRLMYRHELSTEDLSYALAMPPDEVIRLATRTQDLIETLVSGLDALANGRRTCPELAPLVNALFPKQGTPPPAEFEAARTDLLSHMIKCPECTRPINIRYTVPQMVSHPRITPLSAEVRQQLMNSLPPAVDLPAPRFGTTSGAADSGSAADSGAADSGSAGSGSAPTSRGSTPATRTPSAQTPAARVPRPQTPAAPVPRSQEETGPIRPVRPGRSDRSRLPYLPVRPDRSTAPPRTAPPDRSTAPPRSAPPDRSALQDHPTLPSLPVFPARPSPKPQPLSAPPSPSQDTPLYDALLSQAWAREILARADDVTATVPNIPAVTGRGPANRSDDAHTPVIQAYAEPVDGPEGVHFGPGVRFVEALAWAGARVRSTTIKIVIIVVAGTAGTLTGMNLLGPAIGTGRPADSLQSSATQPATAGGAPAARGGLAERLRIPPMVTLDEFGQGNMVLTLSEGSLEWRISAPGLIVSPSSGTLKPGRTDVITLRAQRIRHWCGVPTSVTTSLTVQGPDDSITTTVRWRTC
ncbi:hypothetical protein [Streptosporangium sp. NPDC000396]|uniref:hypothetical protein n=1 Tax=Streptosporangium sp. NPDC000396 TaxID=3366185 RepID=UPI0036B15AEA